MDDGPDDRGRSGGPPQAGRAVLVVGRAVVAAGALLALAGLGVRPAWRQEVVGVGLALIMAGLMVVLLGNYLRHAEERDGPAGPEEVRRGVR